MDLANIGFGVTGHLDEEVVRWLAPTVEEAGFRTLWFNDIPGGDSLARVHLAASLTSSIRVGTGVIPLDRRPATEILAEIKTLNLPADRLAQRRRKGAARLHQPAGWRVGARADRRGVRGVLPALSR